MKLERQIQLCIFSCIVLLGFGFADTTLETALKVLDADFVDDDGAQYKIDFEGPLNPLFGFFYVTSRLLHNKRCFSYGISLKPSPEWATGSALERREDSTGAFRCFDSALELYPNQRFRKVDPFLDYFYEYNECLISMFSVRSQEVTIQSNENITFSYFMKRIPEDIAEKLLAVLFLLSEGAPVFNFISFQSFGKAIYKKLIFNSEAMKFELQFNTKDENGDLVFNVSTLRVIRFFINCGKVRDYKNVIRKKIMKFEECNHDAIHLLETPEFLMQCFIYEYAKNDRDRYVRIARNIFILLKELGITSPMHRPHVSYFLQTAPSTRSKGNKAGVGDDGANGNKSGKLEPCAAEPAHLNKELCIRYRNTIKKVFDFSNAFPFTPFRPAPQKRHAAFYSRGWDGETNGRFVDSTETLIFSILCLLFYDSKARCFRVPATSRRTIFQKKMHNLFTKMTFDPYKVYTKCFDEHAAELSNILSNLPDSCIRYVNTSAHSEAGGPWAKIRNGLESEILNVLYAMSYIAGKTGYLGRIKSIMAMDPEDKEAVLAATKNLMQAVLNSLSVNNSIIVKFMPSSVQVKKANDRCMVYANFDLKYRDFKASSLFVELQHGEANCSSNHSLKFGPASGMQELRGLLDESEDLESTSLISDLLCKTIEHNCEIIFGEKFHAFSEYFDAKFSLLTQKEKSEKNIDHLISGGSILSLNVPMLEKHRAFIVLLDYLRGKCFYTAIGPIENIKITNFFVNVMINELELLRRNYDAASHEKLVEELFIMSLGVKTEESMRLWYANEHWRELHLKFSQDYSKERCQIFLILLDYPLLPYNLIRFMLDTLCACNELGDIVVFYAIPSQFRYFALNAKNDTSFNLAVTMLFDRILFSRNKSLVDLFFRRCPVGMDVYFSLFQLCVVKGGHLASKLYEIAHRIKEMILRNEKGTVKCWRTDLFRHASIWNTLLFEIAEEGKDITVVWTVCEYAFTNLVALDCPKIGKMKNAYGAIISEWERISKALRE